MDENHINQKFIEMIESRSIQLTGDVSHSYMLGFYLGFVKGLTHVPEVKNAMLAEIERWQLLQNENKL